MLNEAIKRNATAIQAGRVDLRLGDVNQLPFDAGSFNKVLAINCIYFWEDPVKALRKIKSILRVGGIAAITVRSGKRGVYQNFTREKPIDLFAKASFEQISIESNTSSNHPLLCALGSKA